MAHKRKAVDLLSVEEAVVVARRQLRGVPILGPSMLPLELQMQIWTPIAKEMNVLDLLNLAWVPSWGIEGIRRILKRDQLWMFFWDRDFLETGYMLDIPLRIPEFLADPRIMGPVSHEDEIAAKTPWRSYYLWTHFALRTLTKIVADRVYQDARSFKNRGGSIPLGTDLILSRYRVKSRTFADLELERVSPENRERRESNMTIFELIWASVDKQLETTLPFSSIWLADQGFWGDYDTPESQWSLPVVAARYIITMGLQPEFRHIDLGDGEDEMELLIPGSVMDYISSGGKRFILKWLIWCLNETSQSTKPRYTNIDHVNVIPQQQGNTAAELLQFMALNLSEEESRLVYLSDQYIPVVPRKIQPDGRNKLFLGAKCAKCQSPAQKRCTKCKSVAYCSKKCQVQHWSKEHRNQCNTHN